MRRSIKHIDRDAASLRICDNPFAPKGKQGCGTPLWIDVYKGGKAVFTTNKGVLATVDVNTPEYPQPIKFYTLADFDYPFSGIAVAEEYSFLDESGNNMVIDLAVTSTSGSQGSIHTVDVTEPYNPRVLGVVKDSSGNVVNNILATDITISKQSGLVYVTAGMSVYVIDIRDPRYPVLLNVITQAPGADGNMMPLGYSPAVAEKDGWLYLANQQKGLRVLDLDPVYLKFYCGDGEFSVGRAFCTDYYPALTEGNGWKEIILLGYDANYNPLNAPGKVNLTGVTPTITKVKPSGGAACEDSAISDGTCRATFTEGVAKFYVKNEPGLDPAQNPYVTLNFEIDFSGYAWWQNLLNMSPLNMLTKKATVRLRVRNNSNVTFGEVLNGEAVFVGDVDAKGKGGSIGLSDRNLNFAIEKFFEQ